MSAPTDLSHQIVAITTGKFHFLAQFESNAPKTAAWLTAKMPLRHKLIHVRWSGEAVWMPFGDGAAPDLPFENHTSHPSAGQILVYPGGYSETEILFCYGGTSFASKMGPLAANHVLTIIQGAEQLAELGRTVLWEGAQPVHFELLSTSKPKL